MHADISRWPLICCLHVGELQIIGPKSIFWHAEGHHGSWACTFDSMVLCCSCADAVTACSPDRLSSVSSLWSSSS